jgi:hypothetical protein
LGIFPGVQRRAKYNKKPLPAALKSALPEFYHPGRGRLNRIARFPLREENERDFLTPAAPLWYRVAPETDARADRPEAAAASLAAGRCLAAAGDAGYGRLWPEIEFGRDLRLFQSVLI